MWLKRLVALARRGQAESEISTELRTHLDLSADEHVRRGLGHEEARRLALSEFGNVESVRAEARNVKMAMEIEAAWRDVRLAARSLLRRPGFLLAVAAVLGIGIGGVASVYGLLESTVFRDLPYPSASRLVLVEHRLPTSGPETTGTSLGLYLAYRSGAKAFDAMGLHSERILNVRLPDQPSERVQVTMTSASLFQMLGARPIMGRLFTNEDSANGFQNTTWEIPVLISNRFWRQKLSADPNAIGSRILLNERSRRVIGVLPDEFTYPSSNTDIWMLFEPPALGADLDRDLSFTALGRLAPGVTLDSAEGELSALAAAAPRSLGLPDYLTGPPDPRLKTLRDALLADIEPLLWTLAGAMLVLLAMACTNVSSLFVARAQDRRSEFALRLALGATNWHLFRTCLAEALLIGAAAAGVGLLVLFVAIGAAASLVSAYFPDVGSVSIAGSTILFVVGLSIALAAGYCVLSLTQHKVQLAGGLASRRMTSRRRRGLLSEPLIAVQSALALVLLIGASLMLETHRELASLDLGFATQSMETYELRLSSSKAEQYAQIFTELADRSARLPAVEAAAIISSPPLTPSEDAFPVTASTAPVAFKFFTSGYFELMGYKLLDGVALNRDDVVSLPHPVVINSTLARRLFGDERAVGKTFVRRDQGGTPAGVFGKGPVTFTVVGVVDSVRELSLRGAAAEVVYVPITTPRSEEILTPLNATLIVRTGGTGSSPSGAIRSTIAEVDPGLSVGTVQSMQEIQDAATVRERSLGVALASAATLSFVVAVIGIYGSVARSVSVRTREIGVRMALGSSAFGVLRAVVRDVVVAVGLGTACGLLAALIGARGLGAFLYGVAPGEPLLFAVSTVVLLTSALAAAALAGRRALRLNLSTALRGD